MRKDGSNSTIGIEKATVKQQELYDLVFKNTYSGIIIIDIEDNRFADCNNQAVSMLGYDTKESVLHLHPAEFSPEFQPDGRRSDEKAEEMIAQAVKNGSNLFEWKHKTKDGRTFWAEVSLTYGVLNGKRVLYVVLQDIDDRKKAEEALVDSHNLLTTIINTVPLRVFWKDKELNYMGCNSLFAEDAGKIDPQEIIGKSDYDLSWKDEAELYRNDDRAVIDSKRSKLFFEEPQTTPEGKTIWLKTSKVPLYNDKKEAIGLLGVYEDITEIKIAQNALKESNKYLQAIIENEPECVKLVDERGRLIDMNPAGLAMLQAENLEEIQAHPLTSYILPQWRPAFIKLHKEVMKGNRGILEFEVKGLKGQQRWLETHAVPMYDAEGNVTALLGITRDITQRKSSEKRIEYMANFDPLTGLPNRAKLDEQLGYVLSLSKRNKHTFSLMFLDIDHFKNINDTLGHNVGDSLLVKIATRIKDVLREEDTVARLGGDEFILLLPNTGVEEAQQVAHKLLQTLQAPFVIQHHKLIMSASIGIAVYPIDGQDKETLSKNADIAMYRAKSEGRNSFSFFTKEMQVASQRNLQLSNALHYALSNNEMHIVYQPQISLQTGKIIGVEALLRWDNPEFGSISPVEFISVAENNGLILPIGEWVLHSVAVQLKRWIQNGMAPIVMAVNLSAVQFRHPNLPDVITQIFEEVDIAPEHFELELTESVTMHNPQGAVSIMNNLSSRGVRMAIDDFGTGYSSLSYLKKFKIDKLKIDRSFVNDITTDPEDKAIVGAIIHMAQSLGLVTIAEGVETKEQLDYLKEQGCDEVQGYYYSKPLLPDQFEEFYKKSL